MELRILSVNVGRPKIIALMNGEPVLSGIGKRPLGNARVFVSKLNIDGDGQADLTVHGGFDKAVYAYCVDHWPWWEKEHGLACAPGTFGENLTITGANEDDIAIGDRFAWGDVELEVAQPRAPCFKFNLHTQRADAAQQMTISGRCGFYLRVVKEGFAPVEGASLKRHFASGGASVREAFFAALNPHFPPGRLEPVAAAPGLAESWRSALEKRLGRP
jgi:MOSC domain-containing protein YiiM